MCTLYTHLDIKKTTQDCGFWSRVDSDMILEKKTRIQSPRKRIGLSKRTNMPLPNKQQQKRDKYADSQERILYLGKRHKTQSSRSSKNKCICFI